MAYRFALAATFIKYRRVVVAELPLYSSGRLARLARGTFPPVRASAKVVLALSRVYEYPI